MAISFSRPDPSSPAAIASATFTSSRRGFEPNEVRELLRMVAAELARLQEREKFLERELRVAQRSVPNAAVALDDEVVTRLLGEEAARILQTAREAATQIRVRAEEGAARVLREADDEAQRVRQEAEVEAARRRADATADAESELAMAKQQGRDMVEEARSYRERVLSELARRREMARQQIEQLVHGRDRLVQAFERARLVAVDVMAEITPLGEPTEYVNLAPTTGPVPVMVPAGRPEPPRAIAAPEPEPEREPEPEAMSPSSTQDVVEHDIAPLDAEVEDAPPDAEVDDAHADDVDDEQVAPVVALFAGELERQAEPEQGDAHDADVEPAAVEDLFARLRAARADAVVRRVVEEPATSVFSPTPAEPTPADDDGAVEDNVFTRRDATLTPLIVAAARKLKRVLADEQNDVLSTLRRAEPVRSLDTLLPWESEQVERYAGAVQADLEAAALAGAASVDSGTKAAHRKDIARTNALRPAVDALAATVVVPLRDRIARAVDDADGDNEAIADIVRSVYREWKTQRIDEHLDDVVHTAFGRGAFAALAPGTPVCWLVDPHGPACPDAEDNALAGTVPTGSQFPTDHVCAPAHPGCRCVLALADQ